MDSYQSCNGVQDFMNLTIRQSHILIEVETMNPDVACFQVRIHVCVSASDRADPHFQSPLNFLAIKVR